MRTFIFLLICLGICLSPLAVAAQHDDVVDLPPVVIDALDGYRWSTDEALVAPGQRIVVTNRDVERHTFTIDEWGFDDALPTLAPVEFTVPVEAQVGSTVQFYSSVGDDRESGLEGVIRVVTPDEILADADRGLRVAATIENRVQIQVSDEFAFTPATLDVEAGAFLEIRNTGVIEHHFVVDEWDVNETLPSGDVALVQVPEDARTGDSFTFYCSVPGHLAQGMSGLLTIVPARASVQTVPREGSGRASVGKDLRPFVPEAAFLGPEWSRLRSGSAETLLEGETAVSSDIFPYDGLGAIYVGPQGSRVTLIVLPITEEFLPANQVEDAIGSVQSEMVKAWDKDRIASAAFLDAEPPIGCDAAQRASGIVPVLTIPAGATACQLRNAGVAIFVTVEGNVGDATGVDAADDVIELLLSQRPPAVGQEASGSSYPARRDGTAG